MLKILPIQETSVSDPAKKDDRASQINDDTLDHAGSENRIHSRDGVVDAIKIADTALLGSLIQTAAKLSLHDQEEELCDAPANQCTILTGEYNDTASFDTSSFYSCLDSFDKVDCFNNEPASEDENFTILDGSSVEKNLHDTHHIQDPAPKDADDNDRRPVKNDSAGLDIPHSESIPTSSMGLCLDKNESFITPEAESSASIDKESYGGSNSHEVPFETNSNVSMPRIDSALVDESHVPEAALNTSDISKEHAKVVPPKEHGKRCESDHIGDANFREGSKTKDTLSLENGNGEIGAVALDQFVSVKAKSRKGCRISKDTTASDTKDTKEESIVSPGPAELSESRDNYEPDGIPSREPQGPGNSIRITVEKEGHRRQPPVRGERCENRCPHFHVLEHEWCTDNSTCKKLHKAKNEKFFPKFVDVPKPLPLRWFGLKDLNAIESRPDIKKRCGDLEYQEEFLVNSDVWIDKDRKFDKIREFMGKSRPDYKSNTKGNDPGHIYVFKLVYKDKTLYNIGVANNVYRRIMQKETGCGYKAENIWLFPRQTACLGQEGFNPDKKLRFKYLAESLVHSHLKALDLHYKKFKCPNANAKGHPRHSEWFRLKPGRHCAPGDEEAWLISIIEHWVRLVEYYYPYVA